MLSIICLFINFHTYLFIYIFIFSYLFTTESKSRYHRGAKVCLFNVYVYGHLFLSQYSNDLSYELSIYLLIDWYIFYQWCIHTSFYTMELSCCSSCLSIAILMLHFHYHFAKDCWSINYNILNVWWVLTFTRTIPESKKMMATNFLGGD